MKKFISLLFVALSMNTGFAQTNLPPKKPLTDAELRQKIIGTWILDEAVKPAGFHKLVMIMSADGTTVSKTTLGLPKQTNEWNYAGRWTINNGICSTTITKDTTSAKTGKSDAVGSVVQCKILTLDTNLLVEQVGKQLIILKRKK